jgi:glycosyltransferase involved in cell wall biosynthesis
VGFAGRLLKKKGVDVLLEAWATLAVRFPASRLIVAGDGPERPALERLARDLGVARSVDFTGHLDSAALERVLAPAWIQAVPSVWEEPFGLVAAEAMMRGTAVVATSGSGLEEQVIDGVTGHLVAAGDVPALARALERILLDRGLAESMGRAGREKALLELSEDRYIDRLLGLYQELIASPAPAATR